MICSYSFQLLFIYLVAEFMLIHQKRCIDSLNQSDHLYFIFFIKQSLILWMLPVLLWNTFSIYKKLDLEPKQFFENNQVLLFDDTVHLSQGENLYSNHENFFFFFLK